MPMLLMDSILIGLNEKKSETSSIEIPEQTDDDDDQTIIQDSSE